MATLASPTLFASSAPSKRRRPVKMEAVYEPLAQFCASLQPGDLVPTHTELMRRFDTSERAILRALDDLQREGQIVRRRGIGTFIAQKTPEVSQEAAPVASNTILAIGWPDYSFFDRCLQELYHHAKAANLSVACRLVEDERDFSVAALAGGQNPLGFVVFSWRLSNIARQLQDAGHRVVLIGTPPIDAPRDLSCVYGDQEEGGYLATRHLLELGHRRIAFCGFLGYETKLRWQGHQRALQSWNAPVEAIVLSDEEVVLWDGHSSIAQDFFARPNAPTALLAWNDLEALKLLRVLTRAKIRVPEQVSLCAYDNLPESLMVHPALTTVDPQTGALLEAALKLLTHPKQAENAIIEPRLLHRESTAAPRG